MPRTDRDLEWCRHWPKRIQIPEKHTFWLVVTALISFKNQSQYNDKSKDIHWIPHGLKHTGRQSDS